MTSPVRAPVEVTFRATGLNQVRSGLRLVGSEANEASGRAGAATRGIASGIEAIAREGKASGRALKEIITQGAEMALMFGTGGPIVAALGIAGLAIYEHITNKMKEAREEAEKVATEVGRMANAGQSGDLQTRMRQLQFGQPFGEKGERVAPSVFVKGAFQGSLSDLQARWDNLITMSRDPSIEQSGVFKAMRELSPDLEKATAQFEKLRTAVGNIQSQPASMTGLPPTKIATMTDEAAKKEIAEMGGAFTKILAPYYAEVQRKKILDALPVQRIGGWVPDIPKIALPPGEMPKVAPILKTAGDQIVEEFEKSVQEPLRRAIQTGMSHTISDAISEGIMSGFESGNISKGFEAAGKAVLAGIGGILKQMGEVWVEYGISMTALGQALWNPFTSGPAAIAIGATLIALGSTLGAVAHGHTGGGAPSVTSSAPQIIDRGLINPLNPAAGLAGRTPVVNYVTIIGPRDPEAQRAFDELQRYSQNRGTMS